MNILMIEDDRELCSAVSFRLEQEGFSVTLCHDGEEGLYYMQETPTLRPCDPGPDAPSYERN